MKTLLTSITILLLLGLSVQGAVAQGLEDAEGLESMHSRLYSAGSSTTVSAADSSDDDEPMEGDVSYSGFEIIALTFDSDEHAEAFLEEMRGNIESAVEDSDAEAESEISDIDIDNDGFAAVMNVENTGVNAIAVFVDGNHVFLIDVTDPDRETAVNRANAVAEFVADADVETDEISLNEDGTSTGGVFDRMPAEGDDLVGDLDAQDSEVQLGED